MIKNLVRQYYLSCVQTVHPRTHIAELPLAVPLIRKRGKRTTNPATAHSAILSSLMSAVDAAAAGGSSSEEPSPQGWTLWVGKPVKTRDSTGATKYDHG